MTSNKTIRRSFNAHFRHLCESNPSKELIVTYDDALKRSSLTLEEGFKLSCRFAHLLRCHGIQRGDVVTSTLPCSLEATVVNLGTILAGAVIVTVDVVSQSGEELFHVINKGESKMVIVRSDTVDKAWELMKDGIETKQTGIVRSFCMPRIPSISNVMIANRETRDENEHGLLDYLRKQNTIFIDEDVTEDDSAIIFLTSGTTGFPKLAIYTHGCLLENAKNGEAAIKMKKRTNYYIASSWSWGVSAPVDILWHMTRVSPDCWHTPKDMIKLHARIVKTENVRSGFLSPLSAVKILEEIVNNYSDSFMFDQLFVAGVPVNQVLGKKLLEITKILTVRYGSTEHITISYNNIEKLSDLVEYDCGCVYPGSQVRVVDDNFQDVPDGEPGLLLIKTTGTFHSYLNDPEKTAKSRTADGWYNTSDAGYIRPENKHVVVIGRFDYLINHKSMHIYPAWIERPIRDHPEVKDVVVLPVPHEVNNQNICACVIKHPDSTLTTMGVQDIIAKLPQQDGKHLVPPHHVLFYDVFPGNARGKIVMNTLIEDAMDIVKKQKLIIKHVHMG